jgi:O-antigen/teichoic acid export membrane protein
VRIEIGGAEPLPAAPVAAPDCKRERGPLCDINWESAPGAWVVRRAEVAPAERTLLATRSGAAILIIAPERVVVTADSPDLRRWPYYNYLLHVAGCVAAGRAPPRFADFAGSPMPQVRARRWLLGAMLGLWALALVLYQRARVRGRARPDAAHDFFHAAVSGSAPTAADRSWAESGFARPLSGLLTLLAAMLLCVGPYFALQSLLATKVQPFPEADGLWRTTFDALWIAWMTFDLGTQTAFVKYFAEHRATDQKTALADVQFYVWWQVFARLFEISLLLAMAVGVLPYSRYAIYAPFVALYAACYVPAVSGLGKLMCQALQRFDYFNLLDMIEYRLLVFIVPIPLVLAGRAWGIAHPIYGEAFGAAVGLGLGQLATNVIMLGLGLFVLVRIGVPVTPLFLAQFDRRVVRRQLGFGLKLTLGQEPFRLTSFLESIIITTWLADFTRWLGIRDLLQGRLTWLYFFAWGYYQSAVPALSEALAAGKRRLAQYYVARYLQFGFLFSATVFSLLLAVGPSFIRGALGAQWARAADYLVLAAAAGLLLPPAWLSDSLQQGAGRPGANTVIMLCEQATRLGLFFLCIPRLQFAGIYVALLVSLALKTVIAWVFNHRRVLPLALPWWATLGAPALAGLANYAIWRGVAAAVAPQSATPTLALFFVAGAGSFFLCLFLSGLCGGLDPAALEELDRGARMSALVRPICRALAAAGRAGARLAPVAAGPLPLAADAHAEASELDRRAASV